MSTVLKQPFTVGSLLFGADDLVKDWVAERIDLSHFSLSTAAIGVIRHGELVAGVAYSDFIGHDIYLSVAADTPRWASPETLTNLLNYPFLQLDCARISSVVRADNERALKFNMGLGFKLEGIKRHGAKDGVDYVLFGMLRDEYLTGRFGPRD